MDYISGFHGVEELINSGSKGILYIAKKSPRAEELIKRCRKAGLPIKHVKKDFLDKKCGRDKHRGYAFLPEEKGVEKSSRVKDSYDSIRSFLDKIKAKENPLVLILDGITDPHNLGAILRSADQFAVDLVVIPNRRSAGESDTVARTSAGALEWVPLLTVSNLKRVLEDLKEGGFWIYGADMGGTAARELNLSGPTALVMGSEGAGLSRIVKETCDGIVSIPMAGHVDSLNVSVAAGILLYEARRELI
ncbi:MAG: 23S rRNA (guanosine(2251)-2'-O)-methyltransferase RlmB [Spirochaetales bacterium]|nr:23S rRNA (guanosine(2251)-2'-O)-methyltransferase RlmB [Spirochaetales bacterium]